MYDIIEKKKNKLELTKEEIEFFINGYTNGEIPDYQVSALLMAIVLNGMTDEEIINLTLAMANSSSKIDLSMFDNTVDKHSTGGIGDKTTLVIAPIVACLNCKVAKMSGRALGFTGGTIDKLESIKGYKTNLSKKQFIKQVSDINVSIISQTEDIALADKKIYALRDVTATVDNIPLIASSIMSKKIASGAKNLVIDVKVGSGAFMKDLGSAYELANKIVNIGEKADIKTVAVITNMDQPLGNNIGNSLEIEEVIKTLNNEGPNDLKEICVHLATIMNSITNKISIKESMKQVIDVLESRKAYNKFLELIKKQGGNLKNINKKAKYSYVVYSQKEGYISKMNSEEIGKISTLLGAGRLKKEDKIDYLAGIVLNKKIGDYVKENDNLATFYSSNNKDFKELEEKYINSLDFSEEKIETQLIKGIVGKINE